MPSWSPAACPPPPTVLPPSHAARAQLHQQHGRQRYSCIQGQKEGEDVGQELWWRRWSWDITCYLEEPLSQAVMPHSFSGADTSCPGSPSALPKAVSPHRTRLPVARGWDRGPRRGSSRGHAHSGRGKQERGQHPEPGKDPDRPPEALFSPQPTPEKRGERAEGGERGKREEQREGKSVEDARSVRKKRTTSLAEQNEGSCEIREAAWLEGPPQRTPP